MPRQFRGALPAYRLSLTARCLTVRYGFPGTAAPAASAIAFAAAGPTDEQPLELSAALGAVRPGGRVVAGTDVSATDDVAVIASDAVHWVATRTSGAPLFRLVRGPV